MEDQVLGINACLLSSERGVGLLQLQQFRVSARASFDNSYYETITSRSDLDIVVCYIYLFNVCRQTTSVEIEVPMLSG